MPIQELLGSSETTGPQTASTPGKKMNKMHCSESGYNANANANPVEFI